MSSEYNALASLAQKKNASGQLRLRPELRIEGVGEEQSLVVVLPLRELQKARRGTGQRRSVGFAMAPAEFTLADGSTFQLSSPWVALSAR